MLGLPSNLGCWLAGLSPCREETGNAFPVVRGSPPKCPSLPIVTQSTISMFSGIPNSVFKHERKPRLPDRHVSKTTDMKDINHNKEIEKQQLEGNRTIKKDNLKQNKTINSHAPPLICSET